MKAGCDLAAERRRAATRADEAEAPELLEAEAEVERREWRRESLSVVLWRGRFPAGSPCRLLAWQIPCRLLGSPTTFPMNTPCDASSTLTLVTVDLGHFGRFHIYYGWE